VALEVDVEQTGPIRGGPTSDDTDIEQLLHGVVAPLAPTLAAFAHRPAGGVRALDDEVAEPGRPRAVDRGEERSGRRAAQQGVALIQRLVREHAVDEEPIDVRAVGEGGAGYLVEQA